MSRILDYLPSDWQTDKHKANYLQMIHFKVVKSVIVCVWIFIIPFVSTKVGIYFGGISMKALFLQHKATRGRRRYCRPNRTRRVEGDKGDRGEIENLSS